MAPVFRPCAVDLGSAVCGFVGAVIVDGVLTVPTAAPFTVDKTDATDATEALIRILGAHKCDCLILEVGSLFALPTIEGTVAVGNALGVCREIVGGLALECRRRGIPVHRIARRSWSARLVPGVKGGVSNADAAAAALRGLDDASRALFAGDKGQHLRDALGALRGWLLFDAERTEKARRDAEPKAPRGPRGPRPYVPAVGDRKARKNAADAARWRRNSPPRIAECKCPKKHRRSCPMFVPLAVKRARLEEERGQQPLEAKPGTEPMADAGVGRDA